MDSLDLKALGHLSENGRASWSDLSSIMGLSGPSTAERVKRLEETGVIQGYAAVINADAVGCPLMAFLNIILSKEEVRPQFLAVVNASPLIQECHHVTGDFDYLLKIRCASTSQLETVLSELKKAGVARSHTVIALSTAKETQAVPLVNAEGTVDEPRQRIRSATNR
jgi:Lrp/AsnC family leucine-responsive transcriptional regulator